jgi:cytochrome P450
MASRLRSFSFTAIRTYGPVCRLRVLGQQYVLISGVEAANFMGTRAGKDCLRSKEFWDGLVREYGARRMLTGEDGDSHKELRDIMRNGYSRESIKGPIQRARRHYRTARSCETGPSARTCAWFTPCSTWWSTSSAPFSPARRRSNT